MFSLAFGFFAIALLYATVGFGGGTSYIALLAAAGVSHTLIPKISLLCNILVVAGGCLHFIRKNHFNAKLIFPFVLSSLPMAFLGGSFPIEESTYFILLAGSLVFVGLRILILRDRETSEITAPSATSSVLTGGVLGLLSGMVGIGGGIFLSPVLINMGWARSKEAASVANVFILVNSIAGLAGQFTKDSAIPDLATYFPLLIAVVIGGQIGSRIGTDSRVSYLLVQRGTAALTLFISGRLLFKYLI